MTELLAGVVVALVALALVLEPLLRGGNMAAVTAGGAPDFDEFDLSDVEESENPKIKALLALREIEFDRETGKLSTQDYMTLKVAYGKAALDAIDAEKGGKPGSDRGDESVTCPVCGPRPESSASYCSDCGRPLGSLGGSHRCSSCGGAVPPGAKYCGDCGSKL